MITISKNCSRLGTYDMICISIFSVLMAVCSWISIPTLVPFTMQTFGLFLTMGVLGGKKSTFVILIYMLLGAVGLPVFSGFQSGLGVLAGTTGGYIVGFLLGTALLWIMESLLGERKWVRPAAMGLSMILYYIFGTIWFIAVYTGQNGAVGLTAVLGWCVIPFIVPDILKLTLALLLSKRVRKIVGAKI